MMTLNLQQARGMILAAARKIIESKDYLTEVDAAVGDGDHGIGMETGFRQVRKVLNEGREYTDMAQLFRETGKALMFSMGGASGIIFGAMFQGGASAGLEKSKLDGATFTAMMEKALQAIQQKGRAEVGDKTMVDALAPAVSAMKSAGSDLRGVLAAGAEGAKEGMEATKGMTARFGRAVQMGERSIGYQDAGATSVYLILAGMKEYADTLLNMPVSS